MRKIFTSFCSVILHDSRKTAESKEVERRDAREAASRFARGSVAVQHGAFVGPDDLEAERKRSQYTFP